MAFTLLSILTTFALALVWFSIVNTNVRTTALIFAGAGAGSLYGIAYDDAIAQHQGAAFGLACAVMAKFAVVSLAGRLLMAVRKYTERLHTSR